MKRTAQLKFAAPTLDPVGPKEVTARCRPGRHQTKRVDTAPTATGRQGRIAPKIYEHDASAAEQELMQAMQEYKQSSGRMFPTWSEVLEVIQGLGYQKRA